MRISAYVNGLVAALVLAAAPVVGRAGDYPTQSTWDRSLLGMEFQNVLIRTYWMEAAWAEMATKYLLRMNLLLDRTESGTFEFKKDRATGKEILEAFLATFPAYTYSQDPDTGVLWVHPKRISYDQILNQKLVARHSASQVCMYTGIYKPLCEILPQSLAVEPLPNYIPTDRFGNPIIKPPSADCYAVDLPAGVLSVKEILNLCCVADPAKAFKVRPAPGRSGALQVIPVTLDYNNPLAPPRQAAVEFWRQEIGEPTNGVPSLEELLSAISDKNPRMRWAARAYWDATSLNYSTSELMQGSRGSEQAIWAALAAGAVVFRGDTNLALLKYETHEFPGLSADLDHVQDPCLALIVLSQLEKEHRRIPYIDALVTSHSYSEEELASVRSDVFRLAREAPSILKRLEALNLSSALFSAEAFKELTDTNLLVAVPDSKK